MSPAPRGMGLDPASARYVADVTERVRTVLEERLVGAYLIGSAAFGDFVPGRSDVDIAVVCRGTLERQTKETLAHALSHGLLPCPARQLELVVYRAEEVRSPEGAPSFELNVNTGAGAPDRVAFDPAGEPPHWFILDVAAARDHAKPLLGPPPGEVFAPVPRSAALTALGHSLDWHLSHDADGVQTVLNACRARRFVVEGVWSSKGTAAEWARGRVPDPALVDQAIDSRYGGEAARLNAGRVRDFVAEVRRRLATARSDVAD